MILSQNLSKIVHMIKIIQNKHVRVCMWIDSDSHFKKEIKNILEFIPEAATGESGSMQKSFAGIPIFYTSECSPPKNFDIEEYDMIYWFKEDNVTKHSASELKKFLTSLVEQE